MARSTLWVLLLLSGMSLGAEAARAQMADLHTAVAAVSSRMPAGCKGLNPTGDRDPRFGHLDLRGEDAGGSRMAVYEIHLALTKACTRSTVKIISRAVKRGFRLSPDRPIAAFELYGASPSSPKDTIIFRTLVLSDAEWERLQRR